MKTILIILCSFFSIEYAHATAALIWKYTCSPLPPTSFYTVQNIPCNPTCTGDQTLQFRVEFSVPDPTGALGANPYKEFITLYDANNSVIGSATAQTSTAMFNWTFYVSNVIEGPIHASILLQKRNFLAQWVNVHTYTTNVLIKQTCAPPCPLNVTINGNYNSPLTQSQTWIKSTGTTTISPTSSVKLDADPNNGYVELNPGVVSTPTTGLFIAQALDGCGAGVPSFCVINLDLYIQGLYLGDGEMAAALYNQGASSDPTISDSITVKLIDPVSLNIVASTSTLLHTNGNALAVFPISSGSYYIVVEGRNTIETWSSTPVSISGIEIPWEYKTVSYHAYGNNVVEVEPSVYAIYSGDVFHDANIDLQDLNMIESDVNAFVSGNVSTDMNGDGNVDILDFVSTEANINQFVYSVHP